MRHDRRDDFLEAIAVNARASVTDEPGCLYCDVIELDESGDWFAFYEIYRDADAFYLEHRTAPHYARWRDAVERTVVPGTQTITAGERLSISVGAS